MAIDGLAEPSLVGLSPWIFFWMDTCNPGKQSRTQGSGLLPQRGVKGGVGWGCGSAPLRLLAAPTCLVPNYVSNKAVQRVPQVSAQLPLPSYPTDRGPCSPVKSGHCGYQGKNL